MEWKPETCPLLLRVGDTGPFGTYSTLGNSLVEEFLEEELEEERFLQWFL